VGSIPVNNLNGPGGEPEKILIHPPVNLTQSFQGDSIGEFDSIAQFNGITGMVIQMPQEMLAQNGQTETVDMGVKRNGCRGPVLIEEKFRSLERKPPGRFSIIRRRHDAGGKYSWVIHSGDSFEPKFSFGDTESPIRLL
jgi:hypothetical protein